MSILPENVRRLSEVIRESDGRAMLVGGCVRDELMGVESNEWDVEVYRIEPEKLKEILESFGEVNAVGEAFTVYKVGKNLDVSIPRRDRKAGRGHKAFVIEGDPDMSFEEACARRDFTVNAILTDPLTDELVDRFNRREDRE